MYIKSKGIFSVAGVFYRLNSWRQYVGAQRIGLNFPRTRAVVCGGQKKQRLRHRKLVSVFVLENLR